MSRLNEYNQELTGISFEDPEWVREFIASNVGGGKQPKTIYVGRLAYIEQPDGTRTRAPEKDLPAEEGTAIVPAEDRPQIISGKVITRDEAGNVIAEQVPGLERPVNVSVALPASASAALTDQDVQSAVERAKAAGLRTYQVGTVWYIEDPRSGQGVRYVSDTVRGERRFNEQPYSVGAGAGQAKPTGGQQVSELWKAFGIIPGGNEAAPNAPAPVGAAPATTGNTPASTPGDFIRQPRTDAQILRGEQGTPYMQRVDYGGGSSFDVNPDTVKMTLAASGLTPTGDFAKDYATYGQQRAIRAGLSAAYPDMNPARVQSAFFQPAMEERSAMRKERAADLLAELRGLSTGTGTDPLTGYGYGSDIEDQLDEYLRQGAQPMAEGGSLTVGTPPYMSGISRERIGGGNLSPYKLAMRQLTDRGYRPLNTPYTGELYESRDYGMVPPWLLTSREYGPGLGSAMSRWADPTYPGQQFLYRLGREGEDNPDRNFFGEVSMARREGQINPVPAEATRRVGYAPAMANGGSFTTPGPQVIMDMRTGNPTAVIGEGDRPERVDVTPVGQPPPQAPYPRAQRPVQLLDPRRVLMSMKRK